MYALGPKQLLLTLCGPVFQKVGHPCYGTYIIGRYMFSKRRAVVELTCIYFPSRRVIWPTRRPCLVLFST